RVLAIPRPTDDRQIDFAEAGRHAAGLEHLHGVFPIGTPVGVCLYPLGEHEAQAETAIDSALCHTGDTDRLDLVASVLRDGTRVVTAVRKQPDSPNAAAAGDGGRCAVLRCIHQRPALAALVRIQRRSRGEGPVLPVRGEQPGELAVPALLSRGDRAVDGVADSIGYL